MNNLKTLRLSLRMSREEFAQRLGIYEDYILDLEQSERALSDVWTEAVAHGFGVSPEEFASPVFDGVADPEAALPPLRPFACPIALRFALQMLIADIAGVYLSLELSEDQYADAVVSLNAYVAESADDPLSREEQLNRLLKGLQITVLTILQSCEIVPQKGFEEKMDAALEPLARLIETFSRLNVSDPERK